MKKNIDPHKVSDFKNHQPSYYQHSSFCMKTKPNNRYFNGEVKRLTQQMREELCTDELKQKDPALYYCRLGKKMPKKYLKFYENKTETKDEKVLVDVDNKKNVDNKKAKVEETSKDNELLEYQKKRDSERAEKLEKDRKKENQFIFKAVEPIRKDPNRGMRFVDCSKPINRGRLGHSKGKLFEFMND